jgi:ankyrin repeat protein
MQIDAKDSLGQTPLHLACAHGNMVACQILISKGADVNMRDARLHTPLWCALQPVYMDGSTPDRVVSYLLKNGAIFDSSDTNAAGTRILTHAVQHGDHASAATLLALAQARCAPEAAAVSDSAWLAAAERATPSSPLLRAFPAESPAAVVALRCAWQHQSSVDSQLGKAPTDLMAAAKLKGAHHKLPSTSASGLLIRMCKGMGYSWYVSALRCVGLVDSL